MRYLCFIMLLFQMTVKGQVSETGHCSGKYDTVKKMYVYSYVDQMPEFKNGGNDFLMYFIKHYCMPQQDVIQGRIVLEFIVDHRGEIFCPGIKDKKESDYTPAEKEAVKLLTDMPDWNAGKCMGKKVAVRMFLPVNVCTRE